MRLWILASLISLAFETGSLIILLSFVMVSLKSIQNFWRKKKYISFIFIGDCFFDGKKTAKSRLAVSIRLFALSPLYYESPEEEQTT